MWKYYWHRNHSSISLPRSFVQTSTFERSLTSKARLASLIISNSLTFGTTSVQVVEHTYRITCTKTFCLTRSKYISSPSQHYVPSAMLHRNCWYCTSSQALYWLFRYPIMTSCIIRCHPCSSCGTCPRCLSCICNGLGLPKQLQPRAAAKVAAQRLKEFCYETTKDYCPTEAPHYKTEMSPATVLVAVGVLKNDTRFWHPESNVKPILRVLQ